MCNTVFAVVDEGKEIKMDEYLLIGYINICFYKKFYSGDISE